MIITTTKKSGNENEIFDLFGREKVSAPPRMKSTVKDRAQRLGIELDYEWESSSFPGSGPGESIHSGVDSSRRKK